MIRIITGDFGSGKTTAVTKGIRRDLESGRRVCLLVPEQETVTAEIRMANILPPSSTLSFEVSNFTRLANTVFRMVGGLSYRYAGSATRALCMWRTMGELLPLLHEKEGEVEIGRVRKMTAAMNELSLLSVTPSALADTAKKLPSDSRLREKLEDLSLLSTTYRALLRERFDDATEDLDRLALVLREKSPLSDTVFYVDGFISYTEQEYRVLSALAKSSPLTVTLTLPRGCEEDLCFTETRDTLTRLMRMAEWERIPCERVDLGEGKRTAVSLLADVRKQLFSGNMTGGVCCEAPKTEDPLRAPLRIFRAADPFGEAEWIAADIARRVAEEGARYRDFAIIARRAESYAGILDVVMEASDIPCFMAKKTDLSAHRAIKMIYTAYAVCTGGWRRGDVISYLKCGMCGVSEEDADIFELYVSAWRLDGRRFTDDTPWSMNPDGYRARVTPRTEEILARANAVREILRDQLTPLSEECRRQSVPAHCRALFSFLDTLGVEEKLLREAEEAARDGRTAEAQELSRLFCVICDTLDLLSESIPDAELSAESFLDLLRLSFGEVSLARIPTALDEVTVGSADLLRIHEPKHVYLIGLQDGVFPAAVSEVSIFSENDRAVLSELGLSMAPDLALRAARELFCLARAFSISSESVTLLFAEASLGGNTQRPSDIIKRLTEGEEAPFSVTDVRDLSPLLHLWRRRSAVNRLGLLRGSPVGQALEDCLSEDPALAPVTERLSRPLVDAECRLSPETTAALYPQRITLSQSKIDRFSRCPFSYVCNNVLHLKADRVIEFDYASIGSLVHAIIERFFAKWGKEPETVGAYSEEALRAEIDLVIGEELATVFFDEEMKTPRLLRLIRTLTRESYLLIGELIRELCQGQFVPRFFEMSMTAEGEDAPGNRVITLEDGTAVSLIGYIDRVDAFRDEDGTVYLRVIDYKTGDEHFSPEKVERGLGIQLLLYLVSLWKSENPRFRESLDATALMPAAMLYVGARTADKLYDRPEEKETVCRDALSGVYRRGICLDDEHVLRAMDRELSGRYLPVRFNKDGSVRAGDEKYLLTLEGIGDLSDKMDAAIRRIGEAIKGGDAKASPLVEKNKNPCRFCDMKAVCRSSTM